MADPAPAPTRPITASDDHDDSRSSSSSTDSPVLADHEESDFFLGANDSQSSLGVPNFQDMQVDDNCWPPVSRLPNEILIGIFFRLSAPVDLYHCMLVSKRWARNAVDQLWYRPACINWRNHSSICGTLGLEHPFFNYRAFIKRLNLASLADEVNDGSVQPLSVCTRIERLTLTNCRGLTDSGLIALVSNSASLLALDISNDKHITEQSVNAIAEHCTRLQGLNISGCENISNDSMIKLAESCKYIKRLKLNECAQLRDDAILAFAKHCPNILEIDLHQCILIGNSPVTALLSQGSCLRELRLASCDLIDDHAFLSLPAGQTYEHLRILDLTSCTRLTDAAVQKIIDVAPRLRNLVLAKCRNITDVAVNAISQLGKNLHYVHLGHCSHITDEGVKRLVQSCNRIRYIDLGCCTNLTDDSVKRLAFLPKLKRIGLVKCSLITDDSVFTLAEAAYRPRFRRDANGGYGGEYYASSLERVHLSYCINLTLKSIMRLLNSCPRLTHLSLTGVAAFQRDEFVPYCRQAPPEFTPHQRDVFCVFSGTMVSKFREFLNTSPRFEELRESSPRNVIAGGRARQGARRPAFASNVNAADGDGFDDEMADEENDFEGLDANGEMLVDGIGQHLGAANAEGEGQSSSAGWAPQELTIPVPPPAPSINQGPFSPSRGTAQMSYTGFLRNGQTEAPVPPLVIQPPPRHASIASMGPLTSSTTISTHNMIVHHNIVVSGGPLSAGLLTGASTASMHAPTDDDDTDDQADGVN